MSSVQIVNEHNELIGHKDRDKIDYRQDIFRSSALWLTNTKSEVLLAQRGFNKDKDPGLWGPAASGTIDEGETYESNMYKEAEEELGLTGVDFVEGPRIMYQDPRRQWVQWYTGQCDWEISAFQIQTEEVEAIQWVKVTDLIDDFRKTPTKYIPAMPKIIELFCSQ